MTPSRRSCRLLVVVASLLAPTVGLALDEQASGGQPVVTVLRPPGTSAGKAVEKRFRWGATYGDVVRAFPDLARYCPASAAGEPDELRSCVIDLGSGLQLRGPLPGTTSFGRLLFLRSRLFQQELYLRGSGEAADVEARLTAVHGAPQVEGGRRSWTVGDASTTLQPADQSGQQSLIVTYMPIAREFFTKAVP